MDFGPCLRPTFALLRARQAFLSYPNREGFFNTEGLVPLCLQDARKGEGRREVMGQKRKAEEEPCCARHNYESLSNQIPLEAEKESSKTTESISFVPSLQKQCILSQAKV